MADISAVHQIEITAKDSTAGVFAAVENEIRSLDAVTGGLASRLTSLSGIMGSLGGAVGVGFFTAAVAGAIEYQASLANLAQRTGATVEALSAMSDAAKLSDTDMQLVAATMGRFAASVVAAQAGTGKQAAALQALGFNAKTFAQQYQTTDQALLAVAKALDQYQDGLGKTAIEQALMGKSGAELGAFLHELAQDGTNAAKVTAAQAQAARELNDSITKLKIAWNDLLLKLGVELVPVLQKVVDGFDTWAKIGGAALVTFVAWPAAVSAVSSALAAYRTAATAAATANGALAASTGVLGASWTATVASATAQFGTLTALLKTIPALLFAGFAGWELGKWLSDNFLQARLAGIAFVDGTMAAWEALKYAAGVAWAAIVYGWDQALESMKVSFGSFLALVASGLAHVPGLGGFASEVSSFAASLESSSGGALAKFKATMASLGADFDAGRAKVHGITSDMADYAIAAAKAGAASDAAAKKPPPVPGATTQVAKDATKALTDLLKALEQYSVAAAQALGAAQQQAITSSLADVKRLYDQGVIDFKQYWDAQTALQADALDVQKQQLETQLGLQQGLVDNLQHAVVAIDPSKFKTMEDYLRAVYAAESQLVQANTSLVKTQGDLNVVQQKTTDIGKDYIESYLIPASNGLLQLNSDLDKSIVQRTREVEQIGLTATQVAALNVQRVEEARNNAVLTGGSPAVIAFYDAQLDRLHKLYDLTAQGENAQRMVDGWKNLFQSAASEGEKFITDFAQHGSSAFRNLWDDFKTWALEAFAKIAAQTIVVQLAGAFSPQIGGLASNTFAGGGNGILSLLTGGSNTLSGGSSLLNLFGGASNLGTSLAFSSLGQSLGLSAATTGLSALDVAGGAATAADFAGLGGSSLALTGAGSALASIGTFLPYVGIALAAASALGLFNKKPSEAKGQFQISQGTTGFEDNAYVASPFGNLGFNDANTQQFSGKGAEVFDQIVSGALTAFKSRFSDAQSAQFADILKTMTFKSFEGTYTTEDFINKYGGQVLQQIVSAAFNVLDPALGKVEAGFKGTAAEIATFTNSLLGIYDGLKKVGDPTFTANVDAALAGADQATADKVAAFVSIVANFGDALPGVGAQLEALSGTDIPNFIDALGGAQAALNTFNYLQQNFLTSAERTQQASGLLTADFAKLGLAVPSSHQAFLDLLKSIDLTTDSGKQLYASIVALAPLFIQVKGTADQAAQALNNATTALTATASAANSIAHPIDVKQYLAGVTSNIANIKALADAGTGDFGSKLAMEVELLGNAIAKTQDAMAAARASGDYGTLQYMLTPQLADYQKANAQAVDELARFTVLSAQYGSAQAEQLVNLEDWYTAQQKLFSGQADVLGALSTVYKEKWDAIVKGTAAGVTATQNALGQIAQYLQGLFVGPLSPLTPMQQFAQAQQAYQAELVKAQGGDAGALGDVTKYADTYLNQARGAYASSQAYTDIFNQVTGALGALAGTQPNGEPLVPTATSATAAIAAALPVNGTLASSADVSNVVAALAALQTAVASDNAKTRQLYQALIAALANSNSADARAIVRQLQAGGMLSSALADKSRVTSGATTATPTTSASTTYQQASRGNIEWWANGN